MPCIELWYRIQPKPRIAAREDGELARLAIGGEHSHGIGVEAEQDRHTKDKIHERGACDHAGRGKHAPVRLLGLDPGEPGPALLAQATEQRADQDPEACVGAQVDPHGERHSRQLVTLPLAADVDHDGQDADGHADQDGVPGQAPLDEQALDQGREHLALRRRPVRGDAEGRVGDIGREGHDDGTREEPDDLREEAVAGRRSAELQRLIILAHVVGGGHRDACNHEQLGHRGHARHAGEASGEGGGAERQHRYEDRAGDRGGGAADLERKHSTQGHHEHGHDVQHEQQDDAIGAHALGGEEPDGERQQANARPSSEGPPEAPAH
mmetsp:Transcript_106121/g.305107  ORF Transcript_106121/g.305107 Transcript_106121/m.305107 type:complete len:324 (-) Transcript_106121:344-1315(-)